MGRICPYAASQAGSNRGPSPSEAIEARPIAIVLVKSKPFAPRACKRWSEPGGGAGPAQPGEGKALLPIKECAMRPFLTLQHPAQAQRYYAQGRWRQDTL